MTHDTHPPRFSMLYECECGETWEQEGDCACNDRCPVCRTEVEPSDVEDVAEPTTWIDRLVAL